LASDGAPRFAADNVAPLGVSASFREDVNAHAFVRGGNQFGGDQLDAEGIGDNVIVTGHEMIGADSSGSGPFKEASAGHGYFDVGTESLKNIAAAATGHPGHLLGPHSFQAPIRHDVH